MKIIKKAVRAVLVAIDRDMEYRMVDQYHFDQLKRQPPELIWQAVAPCPEARLDAGRGQIGHELFVFGGFRQDNSVVKFVDVFDFKKEKWTQRVALPEDMAQTHLGVDSDGKRYIYLVSGQLGGACRPPTRDCFVFDATTRSFSKLPPLPKARYAPAVMLWRGRLHSVAGAEEDRNAPGTDHWSIAVENGKATEREWRPEPPIPHGGHHRASVVIHDALYVFGGQEGDYIAIPGDPDFRCTATLTTEVRFPDVYRLKAGARAWERVADMPILSSHTESSVLKSDNVVYILGGDYERQAKKDMITINDQIQAYDVKNDFWKIVGRLPYHVKAMVSGYYNGHIYLACGQRGKGPDDPSPRAKFERGTWKAKFSI